MISTVEKMASRQDDMISLVGLLVVLNSKKARKRSTWCKEWLKKRTKYTHTTLLKELCSEPSDYRKYLRMSEEVYTTFLSIASPLIQKKTLQRSFQHNYRHAAPAQICRQTHTVRGLLACAGRKNCITGRYARTGMTEASGTHAQVYLRR